MEFISKFSLVFLFIFAFIIVSNNYTLAKEIDTDQIDEVKSSISQKFEDYKDALEVDKSNYGLNDSESFSEAVLGEGVAYYSISKESIENNEITEEPFTFRGYIFPIKLGDKSAGVVFATKEDGEWDISEVSSYLTFEKDFTAAKKLVENKTTAKFIYDSKYQVRAFADKNSSGYNIVPLKDNKALRLEKNEIKSYKDTADKIFEINKEKKNESDDLGGLGGTINDSRGINLNYIIMGLVFIIISITAIVFFKKKHSSSGSI